MKIRIAKAIADAGVCSRREAEQLIKQERVTVNGILLSTPAFLVSPADVVCIDKDVVETSLSSKSISLWLMHKPRGYLTTNKDSKGRSILFDLLPQDMPRVVTVGRLDMNSEGLLLLTNSGALAHQLESPQTGWIRTYKVRVHGRVDPRKLEGLRKGALIDQEFYKPMEAHLEIQKGSNAWIQFKLTEGKNREIRKICQHFGWVVNRLIRVGFGPFSLGDIKQGAVRLVSPRVLKNSLPRKWFEDA